MRRSSVFFLLLVLAIGGASGLLLACSDEPVATPAETTAERAAAGGPSTAPQAAAQPSGTQTPAKPQETSSQPPTRKFVPPIRGVAEVGYLKPVTKVVGNEVVTVIRVKNLSNAPIAGLRVDEYWFDAQGNPLPSGYEILKKPLMPGEVAEIELRVPKNPKMNRNQYQFRHAYGQVKTRLMQKF